MGLSKSIANRLCSLRRAAGLSKRDVAERADLSRSRVAKMERGRKTDPRASTLLVLAGALGVQPGQLLGDPAPHDGHPSKKGKKSKKRKKES